MSFSQDYLWGAASAAYTRGIQNPEIVGRRPESVAKHFLAVHNSRAAPTATRRPGFCGRSSPSLSRRRSAKVSKESCPATTS